ncbi:MAG TPA: DUF6600 domain-containing protein [Candidatus Udaeobacter sp.]|nr:DUF6600 domain-containing protein [Candidatus Udaeobacter sp.]
MLRRLLITITAAMLAVSALSCATAGLTPTETSMPAARAGLPPEYRFFYDALADYGDWILIEPYGWVFQPRVNFVAWRPYQYGFWAPSDVFGWTWISTEPFGWATYHYGRWMYDRFQGWVWVPGLDWGPSWVAWEQGNGYVGWAPLMPDQSNWDSVPGGPYLFIPNTQLAATDLSSHVLKAEQVRGQIGHLNPVQNPAEHAGVRFNRGPQFEDIERSIGGPLRRVEIEERNPLIGSPVGRAKPAPGGRPAADDTGAATKRAAEEASREARDISNAKTPAPPKVSIVHPLTPRQLRDQLPDQRRGRARRDEKPEPAKPAPEKPAASDSTN